MRRIFAVLVFALVTVPATAFSYTYTFSCGPSWSNLPVSYWINSAGSDNLSFAAVESAVADSFVEWGDPCCSRFSAAYQGTTQLTASNNQGRVVLSWTESNWNPNWGSVNQTIGITFSQVYNNCSIAEAPILFNGIGFTFTDDGSGTDLQSIATHEIGHMLGLGHSSIQQATMYAAYIGGTGARSLHQDDADGVCSLYTKSCSCVGNNDCASGEQCVNRQCQEIPCQSDSDCDAGLSCDQASGDCVIPPCSSTDDCAPGFICGNGDICVSGCAACRKNCTTNADCGSSGYCVDNTDGSKVCLVLCGENAACPGDSECYRVPDGEGGDAYVCGAPDATNSLCPEGYVCESDDVMDECTADDECDAGQTCQNSTQGRKCLTAPDPCDDVTCDDGQVCEEGACVDTDTTTNNNGNNSAGTNNGNNTTSNTGGTSGSGVGTSKDEPVIIIFAEEPEPEERTCSTAPVGELPGSLLLIGAFGWLVRRNRR